MLNLENRCCALVGYRILTKLQRNIWTKVGQAFLNFTSKAFK